jgi:uncharacterized membrane protein
MELLKQMAKDMERLLGHGDAPACVSLPLAAWAIAVAGDGLGFATGVRGFETGAACAIGVGLLGSAGAMLTGMVEQESEGVPASEHPAGIAAHAVGAAAVSGLFAASLALRVRSAVRGESPSALARGLALAGGGLALANALLTQRLVESDHQHGRARLDTSAPLGMHAGRN